MAEHKQSRYSTPFGRDGHTHTQTLARSFSLSLSHTHRRKKSPRASSHFTLPSRVPWRVSHKRRHSERNHGLPAAPRSKSDAGELVNGKRLPAFSNGVSLSLPFCYVPPRPGTESHGVFRCVRVYAHAAEGRQRKGATRSQACTPVGSAHPFAATDSALERRKARGRKQEGREVDWEGGNRRRRQSNASSGDVDRCSPPTSHSTAAERERRRRQARGGGRHKRGEQCRDKLRRRPLASGKSHADMGAAVRSRGGGHFLKCGAVRLRIQPALELLGLLLLLSAQ